MATRNLSDYDSGKIPSAKGMRIGLVVSEWNREITGALANGAINTLLKHGIKKKDIIIRHVPGSFELPLGGQFLAESGDYNAIILIGCVIRGETPHFEYICQGVTQGTATLNLKYNIPFIFGVLTTETHAQAQARAGGKHGNKGDEAAVTAIKMGALKQSMI